MYCTAVFAPTDEAFAALPDDLVPCLLNDIPTLTNILLYHVAEGKALSTDLTDGMEIPTLLVVDEVAQTVVADLSTPDVVLINDSTVIQADVPARNGVIHVINSVLVPPGVDVTAYLATCTP